MRGIWRIDNINVDWLTWNWSSAAAEEVKNAVKQVSLGWAQGKFQQLDFGEKTESLWQRGRPPKPWRRSAAFPAARTLTPHKPAGSRYWYSSAVASTVVVVE